MASHSEKHPHLRLMPPILSPGELSALTASNQEKKYEKAVNKQVSERRRAAEKELGAAAIPRRDADVIPLFPEAFPSPLPRRDFTTLSHLEGKKPPITRVELAARALGRQVLTGEPVEPLTTYDLRVDYRQNKKDRIAQLYGAFHTEQPYASSNLGGAFEQAEEWAGQASVNGIQPSEQTMANYTHALDPANPEAMRMQKLDYVTKSFRDELISRAVRSEPLRGITVPEDVPTFPNR